MMYRMAVLVLGVVLVSASARAQTTLAEAAAAAAKITRDPAWASVNPVPPNPAIDATALPVLAAPVVSEARPSSAVVVKKDEAYWKGRMRALLKQLHDDQTFQVAAKILVRSIGVGADNRRARIEAQAELLRLTAAVANDERAIDEFELEAHRAAVLPGWLVLE